MNEHEVIEPKLNSIITAAKLMEYSIESNEYHSNGKANLMEFVLTKKDFELDKYIRFYFIFSKKILVDMMINTREKDYAFNNVEEGLEKVMKLL